MTTKRSGSGGVVASIQLDRELDAWRGRYNTDMPSDAQPPVHGQCVTPVGVYLKARVFGVCRSA